MNFDNIIKIIRKNYEIGNILNISKIPVQINKVWVVETNNGKFILKQHLSQPKTDLKAFYENIIKLQKIGVNLPPIVKNTNNNYLTKVGENYFDLSKYIEHKIQISQPIDEKYVKKGSKVLAEFHYLVKENRDLLNLKKYRFKYWREKVIKLCNDYKTNLKSLKKESNSNDINYKLDLINELIDLSKDMRENYKYNFWNLKLQPTHGDFSVANVLFTEDKTGVYIIDWDLFKLRPRIWDIVTGATLFSMKYFVNAFLTSPHVNNFKSFLKTYRSINDISEEEKSKIKDVIAYNASIYWLSYTLPALLNKDLRILDLTPKDPNIVKFWFQDNSLDNFIDRIQ